MKSCIWPSLIVLIIARVTTGNDVAEAEAQAIESKFLGKRKYLGPECKDPSVILTLPFCLDNDYEKHIRPNLADALVVTLQLGLDDIEDINDRKRTLTLEMRITLMWQDQRVHITNAFYKQSSNVATSQRSKPRVLAQELVENIWVPDLMIHGLKEVKVVEVLHPQASLMIFENSTFEYSFEARVIVGCDFEFQDYPMDTQECKFQIGSYGHPISEMAFQGSYFLSEMERAKVLVNTLEVTPLSAEEHEVTKITDGDKNETFSVYGFTITTKRNLYGHLIRTYLPAALTVIVSWTSFFISSEHVTGRLGLLVLLSLVEVNIFNTVMTNSISRDISAIELYVMICLICVTLAALEYILVIFRESAVAKKCRQMIPSIKMRKKLNKLKRSEKEKNPSQDSSELSRSDSEYEKKKDDIKDEEEDEEDDKEEKHRDSSCCTNSCLDDISFVGFPVIFICFNAVYWFHYLRK